MVVASSDPLRRGVGVGRGAGRVGYSKVLDPIGGRAVPRCRQLGPLRRPRVGRRAGLRPQQRRLRRHVRRRRRHAPLRDQQRHPHRRPRRLPLRRQRWHRDRRGEDARCEPDQPGTPDPRRRDDEHHRHDHPRTNVHRRRLPQRLHRRHAHGRRVSNRPGRARRVPHRRRRRRRRRKRHHRLGIGQHRLRDRRRHRHGVRLLLDIARTAQHRPERGRIALRARRRTRRRQQPWCSPWTPPPSAAPTCS